MQGAIRRVRDRLAHYVSSVLNVAARYIVDEPRVTRYGARRPGTQARQHSITSGSRLSIRGTGTMRVERAGQRPAQ